jgi:hypothetical protein
LPDMRECAGVIHVLPTCLAGVVQVPITWCTRARRETNMARKAKQKMLTSVSSTFDPDFIEHLNKNYSLSWIVRDRRDALEAHRGGELSYVERALIKRLVWLELITESYEQKFVDGASVDIGALTQLNNTLKGLYKDLGLKAAQRTVRSLREHLNAVPSGTGASA